MATLKITERPQVPALKNGASLLITQQETVDGQPVESLRRIEANPLLAPPIISTATGEVVTVSDSANRPLAGLRLYGKTTQNGVPAPNSPVPLVNVGAGGSIGVRARGKNLLDFNTWKTYSSIANGTAVWGDNSVTLTATYNDCYTPWGATYSYRVPVTPGRTITLSWEHTGAHGSVYIFPNAGEPDNRICFSGAGSLTYEPKIEADFITFRFGVATAGETATFKNIQIEYGDKPTAFEPYKDGGSVIAATPNGLPGLPVSSGGNYTDASGQQWICDERDYERGVYRQWINKLVLNGSETWNMNDGIETNNYTYYSPIIDNLGANVALCDKLQHTPPSKANFDKYETCISVSMAYGGVVYVKLKGYMAEDSVTAFKAALAQFPLTVIHPMATPIETPLSANELAAYHAMTTQKPNTTVYNDAGAGMGVDYIADTELWSKASQTSMIGAVEPGMVASKNYATGDFIVDQDAMTLYRATAPIAKGEAIKPGTNCTATTVVEQLAALYSLINR